MIGFSRRSGPLLLLITTDIMRPATATIGLLAPTRLATRLSRRAGCPQRRWKSRYPFFARSRSSSWIAYTPSKQLAFAFDIASPRSDPNVRDRADAQDGVLKQGEHVLPQAKRVMSLLTGRSGELSKSAPHPRTDRAMLTRQTHTVLDDHQRRRSD